MPCRHSFIQTSEQSYAEQRSPSTFSRWNTEAEKVQISQSHSTWKCRAWTAVWLWTGALVHSVLLAIINLMEMWPWWWWRWLYHSVITLSSGLFPVTSSDCFTHHIPVCHQLVTEVIEMLLIQHYDFLAGQSWQRLRRCLFICEQTAGGLETPLLLHRDRQFCIWWGECALIH